MRILIITTPNTMVDQIGGTKYLLSPNLPHVLGAAKQLMQHDDVPSNVDKPSSCDVLLIGNNLNTLANQIAQHLIISQISVIEDQSLANILPENIALQLAEIIQKNKYTHVMLAADSFGKNLLPRIAGILEISQISEVVKIKSAKVFEKYMYAGNILATIESLEEIKLLTIRCVNFIADDDLVDLVDEVNLTSNTKLQSTSNLSIINHIPYTNPVHEKVKFISNQVDTALDLSTAKVVVSGGHSLGSITNFNSCIRQLASKLHAGVGATRAAVEAGFAPNDCQVGQTGKIVAPNLYIAVGISGAVQHIAGMKDSNIVIAINNDPNAPIFEYADYGIVGDLFDIIPSLISKL